MAEAGKAPVLSTPADAIVALERDLPTALKGRTFEEAGWRRLDDLSLLVPMAGLREGVIDKYYLRLGFAYYDDWPPCAQFVNPNTLEYNLDVDKCWLPKIEGTEEIRVHDAFDFEGRKLQLICCSLTLEFYLVKHGVNEQHVWKPGKHNFAGTLNQIDWALKSEFYKGRQHALPVAA